MTIERRNSIIERCAFCGEIVSFDDDDVVQLHAGQNGMCHATCLRESEGRPADGDGGYIEHS